MSKAIYICTKNRLDQKKIERKLKKICEILTPDNIQTRDNHKLYTDDNIAYAVTLDSGLSKNRGTSLMLGILYENDSINWEKPQEIYPDGNYAIFRTSLNELEVVSDAFATRTIWYYQDSELFIASTSQRAIILFIGDFLFNRKVIPWMLSTGTLGPESSYDSRIKRLRPESSLLLNRKDWSIAQVNAPLKIHPSKKSKNELKNELEKSINHIIKHLNNLNLKRWVLPLSGGHDSRGLLYYIIHNISLPKSFQTITWGLKGADSEEENDALIAHKLAEKFKLNHLFIEIGFRSENFNTVVDRFLECGEGRVDQINAYIDGLKLWEDLYNGGSLGIIRGDMAFGCPEARFDKQARFYNALADCSDYSNLNTIQEKYNFPEQTLPDYLKKREGENSQEYIYRLHSSNKVPTLLSALADVKFAFVEQITPFLSKKIVENVRNQPDELRKNKALFKEVVESKISEIPIATKGATASLDDVLSNDQVLNYIKVILKRPISTKIFGEDLIDHVLEKLSINNEKNRNFLTIIKKYVAKALPDFLLIKAIKMQKTVGGNAAKPELDYKFIAFRLLLIAKMVELLNKDAKRL